jgi:hypothetical protein
VRVEPDDDLHRAEPERADGQLVELHPGGGGPRGDLLAESSHLLGVARRRGLGLDRPAVQAVTGLDPVERLALRLELERDVLGKERGKPFRLEPP